MDATGWLLPRATEVLRRDNLTVAFNKTTQLLQMQRNQTSPQMLINEFRFAAAKSIRTSTIILAAFNTIAAFATVLGILWENYSREKKTRGYSIRYGMLDWIGRDGTGLDLGWVTATPAVGSSICERINASTELWSG